ncbi:nitric oxide-dependent regulator DnrN or NorA [Aquipluma nitroreducens]|uniref:Nitric oxide-dependent regulator DnrN or NorA n=2 Tax=Aquipluma nitroreducens TaxID=2010828 RepID=A0A5K7SFE4_9BACT|nr:nitric oxide-dependent regulator DnrN or NorA [Aquipluma nitroreducens]
MSFYKIFISLQKNFKIVVMKISPDASVGEVVKINFKTASIFQKNNIDFCCGGDKTISEACANAGLDTDQLIGQLETIAEQIDADSQYINDLSLEELSTYIIKRHHTYVRESITTIKKNLEKICQVHGEHHPELFEINRLFTDSSGNLIMHMQKEELMLFPFIRRLEISSGDDTPLPQSPFGSVSNPISAMLAEHQQEGDRFDQISILTERYTAPEDACTTYELTLKQLRDFENDLHRHIHLENNILFPKAIELEKQITK